MSPMARTSTTVSDRLKLPRVAFLCTLALLALAGVVFIADRYPLPLVWIGVVLLPYAVLLWFRPEAWLAVIPIALPLLDLAPWTGWIFIEELDLLLLVTVAVGYWRTAARPAVNRLPIAGSLLFALLTLSYLISALRGLTPLPVFDANTLSNYVGSYNALRIGKGFLWACLLVPLLARSLGRRGENLHRYFFPGMVAGLTGVCMVAVWERHAFPGLMDFSSDYRTTASFSAMHTGGAAFDGFLALSMPLAAVLLMPGRKLPANGLGLALFAVGTYVLLTTFSRALYGGYALSILILLFAWVRARSGQSAGYRPVAHWQLSSLLLLGALALFLLYRAFSVGGYRVLAASLVFLAAVVYLGGRPKPPLTRLWWLMVLLPVLGLSIWLPTFWAKGAYVAFTIAALFLATVAACDIVLIGKRRPSLTPWFFLGLYWLAAMVLLVANHWGGGSAVAGVLPLIGLGILITLVNRGFGNRLWHLNKRTMIIATAAGVSFGLLIPIAGNYYSQERFSHVSQDLGTRRTHWQDVLAVMNEDAMTRLFGMGLGRFPSEYFWRNNRASTPGSFQYLTESGNQYLRLAGPRYPAGFGEVLRFGQRINIQPWQRYRVQFSYRATAKDAVLDAYLCEKLLLYNRVCAGKTVGLQQPDGYWHEASIEINTSSMGSEAWYERPVIQISFANSREKTVIDVDNLRFVDAWGHDLIENGSFERGNDFWFYSSDRMHLPWHAKNLWLNLYFDQGWFGLLTFMGLVVYILIRLLRQAWGGRPLPGLFAAGVSSFLIVGLFDSLLDVPRIATLFYLILLVALYLTALPTKDGRVNLPA